MTHLTLAQISAALDDQLTGPTGDLVRKHLGICPDCREWRERLGGDSERLRELLVCDPSEDQFDELFDSIESAVRLESLEDSGPRRVAVKRSLLGLVKRAEPEKPEGARPPSGAMPRPADTRVTPMPASGAMRTPSGLGRVPPIAPAAGDGTPRPPVFPGAGNDDPELEERGKPDSKGFVKQPTVEFPTTVKPSSAEIIRPGPPTFVPPPTQEGPKSGASSIEPRALRPGEPAPLTAAVNPPPPPVDRIPIAPQWHHEKTPEGARPFEPIVGPRRDEPTPEPAAKDRSPASGAFRPKSGVWLGGVIAPETAPIESGRGNVVSRVAPLDRDDARPRLTHVEVKVVLGTMFALTLVALGLMQLNHNREVDRARRSAEQAAPLLPPTQAPSVPSAPVIGDEPREPVPPVRGRKPAASTAKSKPTAGANAAPAATRPARESDVSARPATPAREAEAPARSSEPARPPAPVPAPATPPVARTAPAPASTPSAAATDEDSSTWPLLCGQIVDEQGAAVAGARVLLADLDLGARTDRNGRFCLSAPPGDRTLSVVALGFRTHRQGLQLAANSPELQVILHGAP